jgi:hypothetical protein
MPDDLQKRARVYFSDPPTRAASHPTSVASHQRSRESAQNSSDLAPNQNARMQAIAQRRKIEGRLAPSGRRSSPSSHSEVLALQRLVGNRATSRLLRTQDAIIQHSTAASSQVAAAIIQRKITLKGVDYEGTAKLQEVLGILKADGHATKGIGDLIHKWLIKGEHGPYATSQELADALKAASERGRDIGKEGKERERRAADKERGEVADEGRYGQDEIVYFDPNPDRTNHRHVKLDIKSDTIFGIVGGAAKARNLEKFKTICRDLQAISQVHGKTPKVYCEADTPKEVIDAAIEIVGRQNVVLNTAPQPPAPIGILSAPPQPPPPAPVPAALGGGQQPSGPTGTSVPGSTGPSMFAPDPAKEEKK